jgi:hypothetical protein
VYVNKNGLAFRQTGLVATQLDKRGQGCWSISGSTIQVNTPFKFHTRSQQFQKHPQLQTTLQQIRNVNKSGLRWCAFCLKLTGTLNSPLGIGDGISGAQGN